MTYPLPERAPQEPVSRAWVSPLASSFVTLPLALCAFVYASFSSMACDSCESAESAHFEASFAVGYDLLRIVLGLSLAVLLVSWTLPWRERHAPTRWVLAVLAPCLVVIGFVLFGKLVDWPRSG
jgi:cell division protein FtsW (lipid II flippase)